MMRFMVVGKWLRITKYQKKVAEKFVVLKNCCYLCSALGEKSQVYDALAYYFALYRSSVGN